MPVKVMRIEDAPLRVMRWDRGKALRLVDEADGARNVDVHINLIKRERDRKISRAKSGTTCL